MRGARLLYRPWEDRSLRLAVAQHVAELLDELPRARRAIGRILGQRPLEDGVDGARELRRDLRRARDRCIQMRERLGHGRIGRVRPSPGEELVRHHAERVAVARSRGGLTASLLGREVPRRAEDHPGQCERVEARCGRDAEVGYVHAILVVEQEVRGLDVPMDDALRVRGIQAVRRLPEPFDRTAGGKGRRPDAVVNRAAVEVLHDDERLAVVLADVEHGHDVRMRGESSGGSRLPREPRAHVGVAGMPLREHLHGDGTAQEPVDRAVDVAHPTARDVGDRRVARRQSPSGHADRCTRCGRSSSAAGTRRPADRPGRA